MSEEEISEVKKKYFIKLKIIKNDRLKKNN